MTPVEVYPDIGCDGRSKLQQKSRALSLLDLRAVGGDLIAQVKHVFCFHLQMVRNGVPNERPDIYCISYLTRIHARNFSFNWENRVERKVLTDARLRKIKAEFTFCLTCTTAFQ